MKKFSAIAVAAALAGCAALPGDGPSAINITSQDIESNSTVGDYSVIKLTSANIGMIKSYRPLAFANQFKGVGGGGSSALLGVGDVLQIGVWEAAPDGLFSSAAEGAGAIPATIDETGFIFVPYAGRVRAAGLTIEGLRESIQQKLIGKAVEPQVLVTLKQKLSKTAVVVGDVMKPGVYPLALKNTRLLDLVATAGGSREATYETVVTLKRGNRSATTRLEHLIEFPENNVLISPSDNILLSHRPRTFSTFGAVKGNELVPFRTQTVTMAEALATVGGLNDNKADATGIFLFRFEDSELVRRLQPEQAAFTSGRVQVPVVYRLNLRNANGFFLSRDFEMRDKDILFVSNHPTAELGKFLQIIAPLISNYSTVSNLGD
ncbi:polysaccharide biosynthesis/export family protein [Roseibium sp. RKSG952]|uniref:polysaccharide biosynthesis/export family protein n=1 Tax=Roseibium sp. RKSG952 TaxID=2529384 RepID=UPI0012BD5950|nr:polysaccharide biosynthesis/export family protein [Roseibium sp. RKSG952]MTH98918.1 polysaccharide export protein [Roseibium sp. RKSG952]